MPKAKKSQAKTKKVKNIKVKSNVPDTSRAKKACPMPMTVNYIDIEGGVKKDKEINK